MQLESAHFMHTGDRIAHVDGREGGVVEGFALWAVVCWEDGAEEEVEQLDPRITVTERHSSDPA